MQATPPQQSHAASAHDAHAGEAAADSDRLLQMHTRVEWQSMLESVLTGEVLKSEAKRLLGNNTFFEVHDRNQQIWFALRSLRSGRSLHQERLVVERERKRVDEILELVINFSYTASQSSASSSLSSSPTKPIATGIPDSDRRHHTDQRKQVLEVLAKVDQVLSLYPTEKTLTRAHPLFASEALQTKLRTLYTWLNITEQVRMQLEIFQKWIWVEQSTFDATVNDVHSQAAADAPDMAPPASDMVPPASDSNEHANSSKDKDKDSNEDTHHKTGEGDTAADDTSSIDNVADASHFRFLERILKESGMHKTMERRLMDELPRFLEKVRSNISPVVLELQRIGLALDYSYIQRLAEVPVCIVHEILRLRLSYAKRISEAPSSAMLEQLREDFRSVLVMAFRIRESYLAIATPSPGWELHPQLCKQEYSALVTECVSFYFRLLRWKLSGISADQRIRYSFMNFDEASRGLASSQVNHSGNPVPGNDRGKSSSVKDTEILESEWEFFIDLINIAGAPLQAEDRCIATGFCNLTLQLFEDIRALLVEGVDVSVPEADTALFNFFKMSHKLLEVVKTKARNTKDFYRLIHTHFERSMEWSIDERAILDLFAQLQHTGHILLRPTDAQGHLVPSPFFPPSASPSSSPWPESPATLDASTPIMFASPALVGRKRLVELLLTRAMPWYDPSSLAATNAGNAATAAAAAAAAGNTASSGSSLLNHLYTGDALQDADFGYVVMLSLPTHMQLGSSVANSGDFATLAQMANPTQAAASPSLSDPNGRASSMLHQAILSLLQQWHGETMDVNLGNDWGYPDFSISSNLARPLSSTPSLLPACPPMSRDDARQPPTALAEINVKPGTFRLVAPDAERLEAVKARFLMAVPSVGFTPSACYIRNERSSHLRSVDMSMQGVGQISRQLLRVLLNGVQSLRERVATDQRALIVNRLSVSNANGNGSEHGTPLQASGVHPVRSNRRGSVLSLSLATATVTSLPDNSVGGTSSGYSNSGSTSSPHQPTPPATPESLTVLVGDKSAASTLAPTVSIPAPETEHTTVSASQQPPTPSTASSQQPAQQQLPFTPIDAAFDNGSMGIDLMETYYSFVSDFGQRLLRLIHDPLVSKHVTRDLIAFAMDWIAFTCSCHVKQDKKTFRWALLSLEFTMTITKANAIFTLTNEEFLMLRARVGQAIQVLISHFEMDGPRSSSHMQQQQMQLDRADDLASPTSPFSPTLSSSLSLQSLQERGLSAIAVFMQRTAELAQRQAMSLQGLLIDELPKSAAADRQSPVTPKAEPSTPTSDTTESDPLRSPEVALVAAEEVEHIGKLRELEDTRTLMQQKARLIGRVLDNTSSELSLASLSNSSSNISIRWQHGTVSILALIFPPNTDLFFFVSRQIHWRWHIRLRIPCHQPGHWRAARCQGDPDPGRQQLSHP